MAKSDDITLSQNLLAEFSNYNLQRKVLAGNCRDSDSFIGDESKSGKLQETDGDLHLDISPNKTCSRSQITKLLGMYFGFLVLGMVNSMIGTTLLELQVQIGVATDKLPLMFTWNYIGRLGGSFTAAAIFDRFHPEMQMGLSLVLSLVCVAVIPLTAVYIVVSFVIAVQGFSHGYFATASSANCFHLFKGKTGPYIQALHFVFSVGCALSPIFAKPFLTQTMDMSLLNTSSYQSNITNSTVLYGSDLMQSLIQNDIIPDENAEEGIILEQFLNQYSNQAINNTDENTEDMNLVFGLFHPGTFYPFMIIVACQFCASIYFFVQIAIDKCKIRRSFKNIVEVAKVKTNKTMIALFMIVLFCVAGIETTVSGLLYTFIVQHLNWDVASANLLATVFWGVFAGARLLCIFLATSVQPHIMVTACMSLSAVSLVLLSFLSHIKMVMWVSSVCIGIAFSCQIPSVVTFAGRYISMSGRNSGICMASVFSGGMLVPALTGILSRSFGMGVFPYVQLAFSVFVNFIFTAVNLLGRKIIINQPGNITVYVDSQIMTNSAIMNARR